MFSWILSIVVFRQHRQVGRWFREYGSGRTVPVAGCSMADCAVDSVHFTPRCRICVCNRHCLNVCDLFLRRRDKNQSDRGEHCEKDRRMIGPRMEGPFGLHSKYPRFADDQTQWLKCAVTPDTFSCASGTTPDSRGKTGEVGIRKSQNSK